MNNVSLIEEIRKEFNKIFEFSNEFLLIEHKVNDLSFDLTKKLFINALENLDLEFLNSSYRKENYFSKEIVKRSIITCFGLVNIKYRVYINKTTNNRYCLIKELLNLKPYQRITDEAQYEIIKKTMELNMTQASKYAIKDVILSRSYVSKLLSKLNGSIHREIKKANINPNILYIEMDEIHASLQKGGNQICPCAIVHEGYKETYTKRKELKNIQYFASSKLSYEELWEVIFDYVDKRYDIDKIKKIFVSGDGASGIKNYTNCFPNAIFVLDKFHYIRKHLNYIFKDNTGLRNIADGYIRNDLIDDFKLLVKSQIEKYPDQEKYIIEHQNYILNNVNGIKNQEDEDYKVSCSMEGHVNQAFARYITSSPYGFSKQGLENKLKLLVYKANKINLTYKDFINLKYNENEYEEINNKIHSLQDLDYKYSTLLKNNHNEPEYDYNIPIPIFDKQSTNAYLNNLIALRNI